MSDTEKSVESKTPRGNDATNNTKKNSSSNSDSSSSEEEVVLKNNNNKEERDDSSSEESPRHNRNEEERRALESLREVQPIGVPQTGLDAEIAALLPAQVFNTERKCLMMTLEARMLLREMVEYRLQKDRLRSGNLSPAEIHNLLMLNMSDKEEQDFIADIQELKRQLVREIRHNRNLELDLEKLEKRIALLIQNRTSVQEIDRELKKVKKVKKQPKQNESGEFYPGLDKDRKKLESYAHLLYSLQTEPKYFAELLYVVSPEQMKRLLDKLLLTLFGDAFSPREEYLLLELFRLAIRKEIMNIANVNVLQEAGAASVIPTMVIAYNRRKQGVEYLKSALGPVMKSLVEDESSLELNAATIYQKLRGGAVSEEEAMKDATVQAEVQKRVATLTDACQKVLDAMLNTLQNLPYGLRLICKQIRNITLERFPKTKPEEVFRTIGYFSFYRFVNTMIVQPDDYGVGDKNMSSVVVRKKLIAISKVLQSLFLFGQFKPNNEFYAMNTWINKSKPAVLSYFQDLVDVSDPEEYLQVNRYIDLTIKSKPIIIVSIQELIDIHELLTTYAEQVAPEKTDPLRAILQDLGEVPKEDEEDTEREIQLTLENKFKSNVEAGLVSEENVYETTKELVIQVFKVVPIKPAQNQTLITVLKDGKEFAKESDNKQLSKNINKIMDNLKVLEEKGLVSKEDRYTSFLKDVALEVINRSERREQQRREVARLRATLKSVKAHQEFITLQIGEFEKYLEKCRENAAKKLKQRKKSKPFKFTFKELQKKGVIVEEGDPGIAGKMKFFITMPEMGKFDIEAKMAGISVAKKQLLLDELLEKKEQNVPELELEDRITLNVKMTLLLINKLFLS
eukprot:TRINITY_DN272_c0_g1_i1.p1 TRINITY_DN272_c0_g1~~TRINITY_DN272_c0_g1_i1.p1  ORF type:complete len:852 (-),score=428.56 TRINITY_DN272_c0_g1_i1:107-2662(-)